MARKSRAQVMSKEAVNQSIRRALKRGAKPEAIAEKFFTSPAEVRAIQKKLAREGRECAHDDRTILREDLRDLMRESIACIKKNLKAKLDDYMTGEEEDAHVDFNRLNFDARKAKLAASMVGFCRVFAQEDLLTGALENRPDEDEGAPTLFDFVSEVRDDGSTCLSARPRLALVKKEIDPSDFL